jgi:hypothetical protein
VPARSFGMPALSPRRTTFSRKALMPPLASFLEMVAKHFYQRIEAARQFLAQLVD